MRKQEKTPQIDGARGWRGYKLDERSLDRDDRKHFVVPSAFYFLFLWSHPVRLVCLGGRVRPFPGVAVPAQRNPSSVTESRAALAVRRICAREARIGTRDSSSLTAPVEAREVNAPIAVENCRLLSRRNLCDARKE